MSKVSCSEIENLLPGYALDALSAEDTAAVEEHLETCQFCPDLLREYRRVAAALAYGAPSIQPASSLRQELMRAIDAQEVATAAPRRRWRFSNRLVGSVAASVAILLLAGVVALEVRLFVQVDQLRQENEELSVQVGKVSQDGEQLLAMLTSSVAGGQSEASLVAAQGELGKGDMDKVLEPLQVLFYMLASQSEESLFMKAGTSVPEAYGMLTIAGGGNMGILVASGLEPLPSDEAYQVWLWKGGEPLSGGLFSVDDTGWGSTLFHSQEPITDFGWIGITSEPAEGSIEPTGSTVLTVKMNSQ